MEYWDGLLKTPYYLVDETLLKQNLEILREVSGRAGCKILLAQKAFSCFYEYPRIADYLDGTTASGLYEARLGYEEMGEPFGLETHVFAPAFKAAEFEEIAGICDHVIFNSAAQLEKFLPICRKNGVGVGSIRNAPPRGIMPFTIPARLDPVWE